MARKNENSADKEIDQAGVSPDDRVEKLVHTIVEKLKQGKGLEAMSLFAEGQMHHILSSTPNLPKHLVELMGKEMADKLIGVFVHSPCPFCKKGRVTCENCDGHGHINHEIVCADCLSFGLIKCDFCDGSGWSSIDSIPAGLRPAVLYQRTRAAMTRIKRTLSKPIPRPSQRKPVITLKKCAQLLMDLNRYIGVLENTVVTKNELTKSRFLSKNKANKIVFSSIQAAIAAKKRAREIVKHMAKIAQTQAKNPDQDSASQKLAAVRADFYESLLDSSNIFKGTNLEHPFLDKAIKKLDAKRSNAKKDDKIIL